MVFLVFSFHNLSHNLEQMMSLVRSKQDPPGCKNVYSSQCSNISMTDETEATDEFSFTEEESSVSSSSNHAPVTNIPPKPRVLVHQITPPLMDATPIEEEATLVPPPHPSFFGGSPVIGIFSQPRVQADTEDTEYVIAASYVKWVECAGARILPIPWDATEEMATDIFSQINGLLFTGGNSIIPVAARTLWTLANKANANGDFFPIWGTCLGFEWLLGLASGKDEFVLEGGYVSHNVSWPVELTSEESELYNQNRIIRQIVTEQPVTMNNHEFGITPSRFHSLKGLTDLFRITSINHDSNGAPFVSTIEPKHPEQYPYYGVQYHPEKNAFEYGTEPGTNTPFEFINHSADAVYFAFQMASFFVSLARQNLAKGRHIYTEFERYRLVYSYQVRSGVKFLQYYEIPPVASKRADGSVRFVGKDYSWRLDDYLADHVGIYKTEYTDE